MLHGVVGQGSKVYSILKIFFMLLVCFLHVTCHLISFLIFLLVKFSRVISFLWPLKNSVPPLLIFLPLFPFVSAYLRVYERCFFGLPDRSPPGFFFKAPKGWGVDWQPRNVLNSFAILSGFDPHSTQLECQCLLSQCLNKKRAFWKGPGGGCCEFPARKCAEPGCNL